MLKGMSGLRLAIDFARLKSWVLAAVLTGMPALAVAETPGQPEFLVRSAGTVLVDKVYLLNARIDYRFSSEALDALDNGVPLVVELAIEIESPREYLWNETIASLRQRYQLSYEPLTQRYVVTNLNSGADTYYFSRDTAIAAMGNVVNLPILDAGLLDPDLAYTIRLQASLDLKALPVPMWVGGYFSGSWNVSSEWYVWSLQ